MCLSHFLYKTLYNINYSCTTISVCMLAPTVYWCFLCLFLNFILLYLLLIYFKILMFHSNAALLQLLTQLPPKLNREESVFSIQCSFLFLYL